MTTTRTPSKGPFGLAKIPARFAMVVTPFFLSIVMTCVISFVSTLRGVGWVPGIMHLWLGSWGISWLIAFPTLMVMLPLVRKLTSVFVQAP